MNENSSCELNFISILYPTSLVVNQTVLYPWPVEFPLSLGGELQLSRSFILDWWFVPLGLGNRPSISSSYSHPHKHSASSTSSQNRSLHRAHLWKLKTRKLQIYESLICGFWNRVNPTCIEEVTPIFPKSRSPEIFCSESLAHARIKSRAKEWKNTKSQKLS